METIVIFIAFGLAGAGWVLAINCFVKLNQSEKAREEESREAREEREELRDKLSVARGEIGSLTEKLRKFITLPIYVYILSYWDEGQLVYRTGVVDADTENEAIGIIYKRHSYKDRHLKVDLYYVREADKDEQ